MKDELVTDVLLRQFLLGKVSDEERQRIESLFVTDTETRERVLAVEQDLIEDYLDDCLEAADRERFLTRYAETAEQRRKLRITKSLKEFAAMNAAVTSTRPAVSSRWSRLFERLQLKPVFVVPVAAALLIAVVFAAVWLNGRRQQRNNYLAVEQELARLNTPSSLREVPPQMSPVELSPVILRSPTSQKELTARTDVPVAELMLRWIQKDRYPSYRAVVRRYGNEQSFVIPDLKPENDDSSSIRIRLPQHILTRGLYQIELSGVAADGTSSPAEEYSFTVER
jgi:hypothetical protein